MSVQNCGRITPWELRRKIKAEEVDINFPAIVVLVGGFQLLSHSAERIAEGVENLLLTLRNKAPNTWVLLSTLLYRPRDETLSKIKIDQVNQRLFLLVKKLSLVGCKCLLIRTHQALVSPVDNKILRPIHVYFEEGLIPSRQAAYLIVRYFVVCVKQILSDS